MYAAYKPSVMKETSLQCSPDKAFIKLKTEQGIPLMFNGEDLVHALFLGASRFGKSTLIKELASGIADKNRNGQKIIFLDTKDHDFLEEFYESGRSVIISDQIISGYPEDAFFKHSLFRELALTYNRDAIINLIGECFSREQILESGNKFFPKSVRNLFVGSLEKLYRNYFMWTQRHPNLTPPSNRSIANRLLNSSIEEIAGKIRKEDALKMYASTLPESGRAAGQYEGLKAEWAQFLINVFSVRSGYSLFLSDNGKDTIRDLLNNRNDIQYIFLEFDFENRLRSKAMISLMFELIGFYKMSSGRDYIDTPLLLVLDEVSDLQKLQNLEPLINKGASKGVSIWLSVQSVAQLYSVYEKNEGDSILASVGKTSFCFHSNESSTLQFFCDAVGTKTKRRYEIPSRSEGGRYVISENSGLESNHITSLACGEFLTKTATEFIEKRKLKLGGGI